MLEIINMLTNAVNDTPAILQNDWIQLGIDGLFHHITGNFWQLVIAYNLGELQHFAGNFTHDIWMYAVTFKIFG